MSEPHHHVYNALQREIYRSVPAEQLLPMLLDKGVVQQKLADQIRMSPFGTKILVGYLRNQDFETFLKFLECICIAHETPEGGSKVEKPIVMTIRSVVADFDQRNDTKYTAEVDEIIHRFQKLSTLDEPEQSTSLEEPTVRSGKEGAIIDLPSKPPVLPYTQKLISLTFTANGGECELLDLDLFILAPHGVVDENIELKLEIGACCFGPFSIPDKYLVITAFYCIVTNTKLKKPLQLTMGHCLQMPVYQRSNEVLVLKADHQVVSSSDKYVFERFTHPEISDNSPYLSFEIQDFCILCGVSESSPVEQSSAAATPYSPHVPIASSPQRSYRDHGSHESLSHTHEELPWQYSLEEGRNPLVETGHITDSNHHFQKGDSTDSEPVSLRSTSTDSEHQTLEIALSQQTKQKSSSKRKRINETAAVECIEKRRRLEYCVLLFEPKEKGNAFSILIYVCQFCSVSISECIKQAKKDLRDVKCPTILQVVFEGPEIRFVASHSRPYAYEGIIFTPKKTPAVVLESEIQQPRISMKELQGLVETKVYPPRIEFEVHINSCTQCATELKIFVHGVSCCDSSSENIYFTVIVPNMQQSSADPGYSHQLSRQLTMSEHSHHLTRQFSIPLEEYLGKLSSDQKEKEVTNSMMASITRYISSWRMTGRSLKLSEEDLHHIHYECRDSSEQVTEYAYQVLYKWKRECPKIPTVSDLLALLYYAHEYKAVEKLIQCCKDL